MGSSGGGGGGRSSNSSQTVETQLSKEQAKILKEREAQYQEYFFPEIVNGLNESTANTINTSLMQGQARAVNQQASNAQQQLNASMAKRGLSNSGMAAQGGQSIEQAKGAAMAQAYFSAQQAQSADKKSFLQMGGAMSPTPTSAAPMGQQSKGSAWNMNANVKI